MNFVTTQKQKQKQSITSAVTNSTTPLTTTSPAPPSKISSQSSSLPSSSLPITSATTTTTNDFNTNFVSTPKPKTFTTAQNCSLNSERPTPPPRAARGKAAAAKSVTAAQLLMIKNIENPSSTSHADVDEIKDEEEKEKEICNVTCRRDSIDEDTEAPQISKLNTIQERNEDICVSSTITESAALAPETTTACTDSIVTTNVTQLTPIVSIADSTGSTAETQVDNNLATTENVGTVSPISSKSTQQLTDICENNREIVTEDEPTVKAPSPGDSNNSPQRKNSSTGSAKSKLPKTPSFSKISNSLQSSLSAISGGRADEDTISKSSDTSGELVRATIPQESNASDKPKSGSRLSERAKKKSWYNVIYPNYKSRAEDFKKLFKEVPSDERLIVDYSCALQRDILVQGRLYVSQNYVCFHANIFRWETYLTIKWKDVTSITKEKTALVIPNAISICTAKEKYFFATFTTRDKAFLMLFRVWQNTLMNKQMPPQEIWQWVHNCYGDELGLTTDDEDYIDPTSVCNENDGDLDFVSALDDTQSLSTATTSDYTTATSIQIGNNSNNNNNTNSGCSSTSTNSSLASGSAGTGAGAPANVTVSKPKSRSYFFSSNKSNLNSSTTASASGSDNKASDNNSGECNSKIQMKTNAKELTLTSVKPDENSGSADGGKIQNVNDSGSGGTKELKSSASKSHSHDGKRKVSKNSRMRDEAISNNLTQLPTDVSDSSDSEENKVPFVSTVECNSAHEGRQLMHTILPINIDTLFNLLFSKSKFLVDFHAMRKTTDTLFGEWSKNEEGKQTRTVNVTVQLAASVGPKASKVTEFQEMRDCSKPGELYSIDINSVNAGIPYADSFSVLMHYCLVRTIDDHTMLSVHAQIKYKKSIWGVVKGFIEKNTWAGLEDFFTALLHALQSETCIPPAKGKGRRPRRGTTAQVRPLEESQEMQVKPEPAEALLATHAHITHMPAINRQTLAAEPKGKHKWLSVFVIVLLCFLIVLNVILLLKLWTLESRIEDDMSSRARLPNLATLKELPNSHEEWIELLRQQEILHEAELKKWHKVLQTAIELLKKVSVVCEIIYKNDKLTQQIEQIEQIRVEL